MKGKGMGPHFFIQVYAYDGAMSVDLPPNILLTCPQAWISISSTQDTTVYRTLPERLFSILFCRYSLTAET